MTVSSRTSTRVIRVLLVVGVVVAAGSWFARTYASDESARDLATRYVDLIATGDEDELRQLWSLSVSASPGALRTAGIVLADAEERIEVLSVGELEDAPVDVEIPHEVDVEELSQIDIRYRLDGEEQTWPIVVGKLVGESGRDVGDWKVVTPLMGSIAWGQPGFADVATDVYLSGVRQVRRPLVLGGGDEDVQPLYPAVYRTQARLDPYYASAEGSIAVTAGDPVPQPDFRLEPTQKTEDRIRGQVLRAFESCSDRDSFYCPVADIGQSLGLDPYRTGTWWRGFVAVPEITVDADGVTIRGAKFRYVGPDGPRTYRFEGTGAYFIDNQSWTPVLSPTGFVLTEVGR